MPSSLVTSTRAFFRLSAFLTIGGPIRDDDLQPAQVGPQRRRHLDAAVGLLVVLHHRDEAASDGHARAVQGMHEAVRSEEHTSELQSLMRSSYAVFCLKKKKHKQIKLNKH